MAFAQDPPGRVGRLGYILGSVSLQPGGVDDWVPANPNRPLITGDRLWVDQNSKAEMHIGGSAVRLNAGTAFGILNLDDQSAQLQLTQGSIEIHLRFLDDNQTFEVDTPNIAFSLLRPGVYRIDADPDIQMTFATVRSGQGEGTGGGQAFQVIPGQQAQVNGDQQISVNVVGAPGHDWFDSWSDDQDRREDQSISGRYCSREMIGYQDLDNAGQWRPAPEYGQVWYPNAMPVGWAPYRYGHWAWIQPWGWTWVDDMAWGFAPFHYGRWAIVNGAWGWVPGPVAVRPVYAPALVAFVGGAGFSLSIGGAAGMAWFPLGPHEVYVPSYHVSEAYVNRVNVSNTVVNNVTITNVYNNVNVTNIRYVNQSAPGAVTAVSRETFVNARPVRQAVVAVQPEMIAHAQVMHTAAVAPTQFSVLGRATVAASAPRPPAAVLTRTVVTKAAPPPPPVAFAKQQQLLQQNPGRPLEIKQVQQIRASSPPPARVAFRPAPPAKSVTPAPKNPPPAPPRPASAGAPPRVPPPNAPNPPRPAVEAPRPQVTPPAPPPRQVEQTRPVEQPKPQPRPQERPAPQEREVKPTPPPAERPQVKPTPPPAERPQVKPPQPPAEHPLVKPDQPPPPAKPKTKDEKKKEDEKKEQEKKQQ